MAEILYGMERRTTAGVRHKDFLVRLLVDYARATQVRSLANLNFSPLNKAQRSMARSLTKRPAYFGSSPERERHKDVWNGAVFGIVGNLRFESTGVRHPPPSPDRATGGVPVADAGRGRLGRFRTRRPGRRHQLQQRIAMREQQNVDLQTDLEERAEELEAVRAANRELTRAINRQA